MSVVFTPTRHKLSVDDYHKLQSGIARSAVRPSITVFAERPVSGASFT
jgi:hypothetical protein